MTMPLSATLASTRDWLRQVAPSAQLCSDSRRVAAGDVFLAYPGDEADGRNHIDDAIERGAAAVLYEDSPGFNWNDPHDGVPHRAVSGLKAVAGALASAWYSEPDCAMLTVGVTGTNGKTSCTQWMAAALAQLGEPTAVIGTLGVGICRRGEPLKLEATGYTTPDAVLLQRKLAELRDAGASALAIEVSSIGLAQQRLTGMHFDIAVFTNLTRDHLDYHHTMAAYEEAKVRLFDWTGLKHAVINLDDDMGLRLLQRLQKQSPAVQLYGYTVQGRTAPGVTIVAASDAKSTAAGTNFQVETTQGSTIVKSHIIGQFNVSNLLAVACVLMAHGIDWRKACEVLETLTAIPGRMQQLSGNDAPLVVIDYAHTPDALQKTLSALRDVTRQRGGRLWCVFGCGGDRDAGKRPQMGAAADAADEVIVTSDNPRSENPADIMTQIVAGMASATAASATEGARPLLIEDRAAAILRAVKHAAKNDVVLLAGKGHEQYQEIRGRKLPFLDADHAALALAARATNASARGTQ
ncbi:MAG: UDP-N-acetylmuramoyl-L-alanyl-D-glutamate--2,6-diaminopimelate ligase [Herminiimonas sp.]|nr:UDP-N-acetylmuramoyl-L-alanyl-D-glutamate--2,6-diaminopimelate ligase [Herminiimonas sp.]